MSQPTTPTMAPCPPSSSTPPTRSSAATRSSLPRRWTSSPSCRPGSAARRDELLAARQARRAEVSRTGRLDFLEETREVREGDWRSPRPRPTSPTAGSRSPGRPSARWRSTPSTPAPRCGSPTSRTPTPRTGPTSSAARSTSTTRSAAPSSSPPPRASTTSSRTRTAYRSSCRGRAAGTSTRSTCTLDGRPLVGAPRRLRPLLLPQRRRARRARQRPLLLPAQDGVAPRGPALERRLHVRPGARSASRTARSARRSSSRPSRRPSRWTRSSTSCATTRPGSTPAAGTTSSRSSSTSATPGRRSPSPTAMT